MYPATQPSTALVDSYNFVVPIYTILEQSDCVLLSLSDVLDMSLELRH